MAEIASWELVTAVQGGDLAAFGTLYTRYREMVRRYVQRRVRDHVLAEDLTADTFESALAGIGSLRFQGCDVGAWLVTIARNRIVDHRRRHATRLETYPGELPDAVADTCGPEQLVMAAQVRDAIEAALAQLSPDQRDCFHLRVELELSAREASVVLARSETSVNSLKHRAVRSLAELLSPVLAEVA